MIRRTFKLDYGDAEDQTFELIVTYDPTTDILNVGYRTFPYDEWSRPLEMVENQDDPQGRAGGPGSVRGAGDDPVIERLRAIVMEYDARPVVPDVAPPPAVPADQLDSPEPSTDE